MYPYSSSILMRFNIFANPKDQIAHCNISLLAILMQAVFGGQHSLHENLPWHSADENQMKPGFYWLFWWI